MKKKRVYVNCPFNKEYMPLMAALLFTIVTAEKNPVICQSTGKPRTDELKSIIESCQFSVHDLSQYFVAHPNSNKILPKFNMPFELGLDIGFNLFKEEKNILIFVQRKNDAKHIISNLNGYDLIFNICIVGCIV